MSDHKAEDNKATLDIQSHATPDLSGIHSTKIEIETPVVLTFSNAAQVFKNSLKNVSILS
jgi:hypothetical protein